MIHRLRTFFCLSVALNGAVLLAQGPTSVDIDLFGSSASDSLEVRVRANGAGFDELVTALTFTIRWPSASYATLGPRTVPCVSALPITPTAMVVNGAFNYRTYNAFGGEWLTDGCPDGGWPAGQWVTLMKVKVIGVAGCTSFNIVNDAWTTTHNRDFFIALNGTNRTGVIDPIPDAIGDCVLDCLGVLNGTAVPGTPCDDADPCTLDDVWTTDCACEGAFQDADDDGVCDLVDGCPGDPAKTTPGICGCGTPETDSDFDGAPDCVDGCPADPFKIAPGICGCGAFDSDDDLDGTPNCNDGCPNDVTKAAPGACGCGVVEPGAPCDDGDPLTLNDHVQPGCGCAGFAVDCSDAELCTLDQFDGSACVNLPLTDTDGDGACDFVDDCPNDPLKTTPGQCGCGVADLDTDNDGIADCNDTCPLDVGQVGSSCDDGDVQTIDDEVRPGCTCQGVLVDCSDGQSCTMDSYDGAMCVNAPAPDADGDGTCDATDGCPNDPLKTAPGQCGCDAADTDGDADLIADCLDGCPVDPLKVEPGQCGCGQSDADQDGDLVADCIDPCNNTTNGQACDDDDPCTVNDALVDCVCIGTAGPDTDSDGFPDCSDDCPLVPGLVGSACDDGDPGTENDVLGTDCTCLGAPTNDQCASSTALTLQLPSDCPTNATTGTTAGAGPSGANPSCDPVGDVADVWYTVNSGAHELLTITLQPGTITHWGVAVYDVCDGAEIFCGSLFPGQVDVPVQAATDYWIRAYTIEDPGQAGSFGICVSFSISEGIDARAASRWSIYPNPSDGAFNLVHPGSTATMTMELLDVAGRSVCSVRSALPAGGAVRVPCDHVATGVYTARVRCDGRSVDLRIIVQ